MKVQFGRFTVDEDTRQLLRDETVVHLSPKAFDLLATLVRERPRALSKADLVARLWPKTFVSDASLAMLVSEVRAALGESAKKPKCVRTVHRHGYAFQEPAQDSGPVVSEPPPYWLVLSSREIPLTAGENIVGRDPKAAVRLDSPSVSRRHARILISAGAQSAGALLEDLDSKNGTFAGGVRIKRVTPLTDGDVLRFGSLRATFRSGLPEPTKTETD